MDGFTTIRLHRRTVKRFRKFSYKITKSYSDTMETIMDFFEWHGISPSSRFPKQINEDGDKTRKRINALIAIIRDIEKRQTKPTTAMLLSLFGETYKEEEKPVKGAWKDRKLTRKEWMKREQVVPKIDYSNLDQEYQSSIKKLKRIVDNIEKVNPKFGKPYYKIQISELELENLQSLP
ncbi:MAG: BfmA/BtgA family mobilization protein [Bacteroidota bacterium]